MTEDPKLIEIPGWMPAPKRRICGTLLMSMPPDQARAALDRLMDESDNAPSMRLVEKSGPEIVEPE